MFRFDPGLIKIVWSVEVEEITSDANIDIGSGDMAIDMGQADGGGIIDQGNVING